MPINSFEDSASAIAIIEFSGRKERMGIEGTERKGKLCNGCQLWVVIKNNDQQR